MFKSFASLLSGAAVLALGLLLPSNASAQCEFTSLLNSPNDALSTSPSTTGSYGTVCVNLVDSNTATITFTANSGYLFGGVDSLALNINTTNAFTASATATQFPGHSAPILTVEAPPGTPQVDGQGNFNVAVRNFDGFTYAFQTGTITVDLSAGTFASAASVLTYNGSGNDAAAHIFVCGDAACTIAGGAIVTGWAGETTGSTVPEPTSVALLGAVVLFVTSRLRKRFA